MVDVPQRPPKTLVLRGVSGHWGEFRLESVNLEVRPGEYLVLLGPSGCGKTTLIELFCGLRRPAAGQILFGDTDITHADPADRRIGYVPQEYELFSGRTAEWNLRFAARVRRWRGQETEDRFARIVEFLNVGGLLHRKVETFSGGERQRIALGRALMADPDVLLLDEPVSALPELMRDAIIRELRQLHDSLGITTVHVSHNLDEALSVADRLAIMDVGRLVQVGTPREVLERPANRFVAEITQSMNVWPCVAASGELRVAGVRICATHAPDGAYDLVVRPEHVRIESGGPNETSRGLAGRVTESVRASHVILTKVDLGSFQAWARDESFRTSGDRVALFIAETAVWLLPR